MKSGYYVACEADEDCPNGGWLHPECTNDLCSLTIEVIDQLDMWYCQHCVQRINKENEEPEEPEQPLIEDKQSIASEISSEESEDDKSLEIEVSDENFVEVSLECKEAT